MYVITAVAVKGYEKAAKYRTTIFHCISSVSIIRWYPNRIVQFMSRFINSP